MLALQNKPGGSKRVVELAQSSHINAQLRATKAQLNASLVRLEVSIAGHVEEDEYGHQPTTLAIRQDSQQQTRALLFPQLLKSQSQGALSRTNTGTGSVSGKSPMGLAAQMATGNVGSGHRGSRKERRGSFSSLDLTDDQAKIAERLSERKAQGTQEPVMGLFGRLEQEQLVSGAELKASTDLIGKAKSDIPLKQIFRIDDRVAQPRSGKGDLMMQLARGKRTGMPGIQEPHDHGFFDDLSQTAALRPKSYRHVVRL